MVLSGPSSSLLPCLGLFPLPHRRSARPPRPRWRSASSPAWPASLRVGRRASRAWRPPRATWWATSCSAPRSSPTPAPSTPTCGASWRRWERGGQGGLGYGTRQQRGRHVALICCQRASHVPSNRLPLYSQDTWLPDIRQRAIPTSPDIAPLDMLTDESTKVDWAWWLLHRSIGAAAPPGN